MVPFSTFSKTLLGSGEWLWTVALYHGVVVSGFGSYEPLQHSIAWGGCPQLGALRLLAADDGVGANF